MPRRKKTGKRPKPEDANEDTSEPVAKRMDQLNLDASVVDHDMQQGTGLSTLQEQLTSQDDEPSNRGPAVGEWELAGLDPQLALSLPTAAYDPEIPAVDNPHYYQVNKVLFAANLERIKRQQRQSEDIDL